MCHSEVPHSNSGALFCYVVGVPQLDYPVLLGRNCAILAQLLQECPGEVKVKQGTTLGMSLPAGAGEPEQWQQEDRTLRQAQKVATASKGQHLGQQGPTFDIMDNLLYWEEDREGVVIITQLLVPKPM